MTSPRLRQILRDIERKKPPEKAPADGLAGVIEEMIARQVEERVSEALDRHRERLQQHNPRVQQLLRDRPAPPMATESPPPAPRTAPPTDYTTQVVQRDEKGRIKVIELGGKVRMEVQRDALGRTARLVEVQ